MSAGMGEIVGSIMFLCKALPLMITFRPQIIHVHTLLPLLLGVVGKFAFNVPLVLTFEGTDFHRFRGVAVLQWMVTKWVPRFVYQATWSRASGSCCLERL